MATRARKVSEQEKERRQRMTELAADLGKDWAEQNRPGSFGCHELLDRTYLAAQMVEQYVLSHPACVGQRDWYALADKAMAALLELYQRIGAKHLDDRDAEAS